MRGCICTFAVDPATIIGARVLTAVVIATAGICALWVIWYRKHPLVKASNPPVMLMMISGILISLLAPFFCAVDHRRSFKDLDRCSGGDCTYKHGIDNTVDGLDLAVACNLQIWAWCTGFVITYGALYYKLHRITTLVIKKADLTTSHQTQKRIAILAGACVLTLQSVVLLAMMFVAPLRWAITIKGVAACAMTVALAPPFPPPSCAPSC